MSGTATPPTRAAKGWPSLGSPVAPPPARPGERSFGLSVGGVLAAIAAFGVWRGRIGRADAIGAVALFLIVAALVRPAVLSRPSAWWARFGHALGWFNSRVLLTLMFIVIFIPAGWIGRLFGNDPLDRRRGRGSRWSAYPKRFTDRKHFERSY